MSLPLAVWADVLSCLAPRDMVAWQLASKQHALPQLFLMVLQRRQRWMPWWPSAKLPVKDFWKQWRIHSCNVCYANRAEGVKGLCRSCRLGNTVKPAHPLTKTGEALRVYRLPREALDTVVEHGRGWDVVYYCTAGVRSQAVDIYGTSDPAALAALSVADVRRARRAWRLRVGLDARPQLKRGRAQMS